MATVLGRVLRYFAESWAYGTAPMQRTDGAHKRDTVGSMMFAPMLQELARAGAYGAGESVDTDAAQRTAATSAWVWSDISLIAGRVASADARPVVKRRSGEGLEDVLDHPFERLLARPNAIWSGGLLLRYVTWWYLLRGNGYLFVATDKPGRGEPLELWPLPADAVRPWPYPDEMVRVSPLTGQLVVDYEYMVNGQPLKLYGEHVVHFRTPNPFDYWQGLSPLTAALLGVQTDLAQARFQRDFYAKDNGIPSAVISLPAELDEVTFETAKQQIREQLAEGQKRMITRAGDVTVQTIQQTLEQMQIVGSRQFSRDELDRVFGVPQGLVSGGLSGDSRLAAEIAFGRNTVQPLIDYFAEELTLNVMPFYGGEELVVAAPNVVPQDRALEVQEYAAYGQDRTINENRRERGLDTLENELAERVPVRLLPFVAPNYATIDGDEDVSGLRPDPEVATNFTNGTNGDGTGTMDAVDGRPQAAGRSMIAMDEVDGSGPRPDLVDAARSLAVKTELERWRRVALREARAGRDPSVRQFASAVLPQELRDVISWSLVGADEADVKAVFEGEMGNLPSPCPLPEREGALTEGALTEGALTEGERTCGA